MILFADSQQQPSFSEQRSHVLIIAYACAAVWKQLCASGTLLLAYLFAVVNISHNGGYCSLCACESDDFGDLDLDDADC